MQINALIRTCLKRLSPEERRSFHIMYVLLALDALLQVAPATAVSWVLVVLTQRAMTLNEMLIFGSLPLLLLLLRLPLLIQAQKRGFLIGFRAGQELREMMLNKLCTLPLGEFQSLRPGPVAALLTEEVGVVENFIAWHAAILFGYLINAVILLAALTLIDFRLGLAALTLAACLLPILRVAGRHVGGLHDRRRALLDRAGDTISEFVQGMPVLRVFNATDKQNALFIKAIRELRDFANKTVVKMTPWLALSRIHLELSLVLLMALSVGFYFYAGLGLTQLVLVLIFSVMLSAPLDLLISNAVFLSMAEEAYNKLRPVQMREPLSEAPSPKSPQDNRIAFERVGFGFQADKPLLSDISFDIPAGAFTAIVGPSGAGKSTLLNLLVRAWDVQQGRITLGGIDVRDIALNDLFNHISMVYQAGLWLKDTIFNNIRMGRPDASVEEIEAAAKAACADEFIQKLPDGYETVLGEGNSNLSGGELQRLSIARAILKDAPVVLLDEATSALDAENEYAIQRALRSLCRGKTVLMVAHRLSTVTQADLILVMQQGRLVDRGTHGYLRENCSLYERLWQCQQLTERWVFGSTEEQTEQPRKARC